jgi:CreA protein
VRRIYDEQHETLIYVVHARELVEGSAKMAIGTVALHGAEVTWENGADR